MQAVDMDMHVKILVVGNGGVGKSSLLARYCEVASVAPGQTLELAEWHYLEVTNGDFVFQGVKPTEWKKTIGTNYKNKKIDHHLHGEVRAQ